MPAWSPPASSVAGRPTGRSDGPRRVQLGTRPQSERGLPRSAVPPKAEPTSTIGFAPKSNYKSRNVPRSSPGRQANGDLDNWLQAERELLIAQRARQFAASNPTASDVENWLVAEREVLTKLSAREIAESPKAGPELDNWLLAERRVLTIQRARMIANSPGARGDLDNWLRAEREVRVALRAEAIARNGAPGGDQDHWFQAEREIAEMEGLESISSPSALKRWHTKGTVVTYTTGCARKRSYGLNTSSPFRGPYTAFLNRGRGPR